MLQKKQHLEVDNKSLRNKLQECELALVAARAECHSYENCSQDLDQRLIRSQSEAQALHSRMESFFKQVQVLLGNDSVASLPEEEHVLERLREVCRREKSSTEVLLTPPIKACFRISYGLLVWLWLSFLHESCSVWYYTYMIILIAYATVCYCNGGQTG